MGAEAAATTGGGRDKSWKGLRQAARNGSPRDWMARAGPNLVGACQEGTQTLIAMDVWLASCRTANQHRQHMQHMGTSVSDARLFLSLPAPITGWRRHQLGLPAGLVSTHGRTDAPSPQRLWRAPGRTAVPLMAAAWGHGGAKSISQRGAGPPSSMGGCCANVVGFFGQPREDKRGHNKLRCSGIR